MHFKSLQKNMEFETEAMKLNPRYNSGKITWILVTQTIIQDILQNLEEHLKALNFFY